MAVEKAQVVIIGGGAIGLSIAYHLARLGLDDVVLLERDRLTSGSSWHAAGIVGPLRASMNLTVLAKYACELCVELERESGQATGYQQTGGLWLAQNPARMDELRRIKAIGDRNQLETEMLSSTAISERLPSLQTDDLAGGMWVAQDGQVNPVDLCMAYAKAARKGGVEIREYSPVIDIKTKDSAVAAVLLADETHIHCDKLVLCAGAWSRQLGALAGVEIPLAVCQHMYLITEMIECLPTPWPIVRDLEAGLYIKGDGGKLVLGGFENNPKPWTPSPSDAGFLMFDEDWDHVEPMLQAAIRRAPIIAEHGITHFMNGPESFTPDTRQIMGEAPRCRNFFVAAGFNSIGIMSSAGVGKVMAPWIRDNLAPLDLWEVDIARFDPGQNAAAYLAARLPEAVHNQFDMHWPYKQFRSGRNLRQSVWHDQWLARGAVFGAFGVWERPLWYAENDRERDLEDSYGRQSWWPAARREALQCQRGLSLFDLSPFTKIEISGANALNFLQTLCCGDADIEPGRILYSLMLNQRGGIEAEITLTRIAADRFRLISGAATRFKDLYWIEKHRQFAAKVDISDVSDAYAVLGLMGPLSENFLREICGESFTATRFRFSSARAVKIDKVDLLAQRLSFVGELGWELFIPVRHAKQVLAKILFAGKAFKLGMAGYLALDSCRLEVGFHHWGHDIGPDDTPFEAGLAEAVNFHRKDHFVGKKSLLEQRQIGHRRQLQLCEVMAADILILRHEPVYSEAEIVGHCTSGGLGFRTGKTLCFVMFYNFQSALQSRCEIEVAGARYPVQILIRPPYRAVAR